MMPIPEVPPLPPGWRFAQGETRRLELSEGDWLLVKTRYSAGERRAAFRRASEVAPDGTRSVNPGMLGLVTILLYLVDWSITDPSGRQIVIREGFTLDGQDRLDVLTSALDALDSDNFDEILEAIRTHDVAMRAQREAEKKTRNGDRASSPTSGSPAPTAGAMSGSAPSTLISTT